MGRTWARVCVVAVIMVSVLPVACGGGGGDGTPRATPTSARGDGETMTIRAGEKLRIGLSTTLSTELAEFGVPIRNAAQLAVTEKDSIQGFRLEVIVEDDACTGPGAEAVAQKLIGVNSVAIVGPMCASGAVAALDDYADANVMVISSSASHGAVTEQGATNLVRTIWNDDTEGHEIGRYAVDTLGLRQAALIDDGSAAGEALVHATEASLRFRGAEVILRDRLPRGADRAALIASITEARPQAVIFGGSADDGAPFLRELRDAGYAGALLGADGPTLDRAEAASWREAEGAHISGGPMPLASTYDTFILAYRAEFGDTAGTAYGAYTYDAMQILFAAIERVAVLGSDGQMTIERRALIEAVKTARLENGASGTVAFNAYGDRDLGAGGVNAIYRVFGGELVRVQ